MLKNHHAGDRTAAPPASLRLLPRATWEAELREVEKRLLANPNSADLYFRRAFCLSELGRRAEARQEYIKVLEREPHHLGALNNLGSELVLTGQRQAARIAYQEAVLRHPGDPMSRVNLGHFLLEESERMTVKQLLQEALQLKQEARGHFEHALQAAPEYEKAHEGLSYVLADLGEPEQAEQHRHEAFQKRAVMPIPYRGKATPVLALLLVSTTGGNVRLQKFLDEQIFQTYVVLPEFYDRNTPLPAHQLVINAIGDTEVSSAALAAAQAVLGLTKAPVINPPAAVLATGRTENAARLACIPGVVTPLTVILPREQLAAADAAATLARSGFTFPLLLRAPGFHTGLNFLRVDNVDALPAALAEIPGPELIVMQYLDARGADGKSRKYRVMMIDGELYPLHVAISGNWKIHYFTAEMAERADHRAEDAEFLENMPGVAGGRAMEALARIQSTLALDYAGIDFGLSGSGDVLLFEANATMVVNPPEADERWAYRRRAVERIFAAVRRMLKR